MEVRTKLVEPVLSGITLTTIMKVNGFEINALPDFTKEIHAYGTCISSDEPVEVYIHGDFTEEEFDVIRTNYGFGKIIKISGDYRILNGGLLVVNNPTVIELSHEVSEAMEVYFT